MTADENLPSISRALSKGAKLCFSKPVTISDLRGLWRFAMWNRNSTIASEEIPGFEWHRSEAFIVNMGLECQPSMKTGNQSLQSAKGKEQELLDKDNEGEKTLKRKRVTWTDDLQNKFMKAVESAGINGKFELKYFIFISAIATIHTVKLMVAVFLVRSSSEENIPAYECARTYKSKRFKLFTGLFFVMVHMYYLVQPFF